MKVARVAGRIHGRPGREHGAGRSRDRGTNRDDIAGGEMTGDREPGRIVRSVADAVEILKNARRIAVLGIRPETHASAPAHYVPAYLRDAGYEIVPVPVRSEEATTILGEPVYRSVSEIPGPVDLVVVFRRSADVPAHVEDLLAKKPGAVWMQLGIRNEAAAERLAAGGIDVVQNRCTMVDHRLVASA